MANYRFKCRDGHEFEREMTPAEFIDLDHFCPDCGAKAQRAPFAVSRPLPSGCVVPGTRSQYPYYCPALPVLPGQKPGEQIVQSARHEREIMAGGWNGEEWRKNQW